MSGFLVQSLTGAPNKVLGTTTNDSAAAGYVGEYIESILITGSATSLTTATAKTVTSISLTAGDWDVSGEVYFNSAGTTSITILASSISETTNTDDSTAGRFIQFLTNTAIVAGAATHGHAPLGLVRKSLSATTTIYLIARANFTVSTLTAWGIIRARRVR